MTKPPISRFATRKLADLPQDIRERIAAVQEKSGFVPNVFLALARRPDEFRAFFAYHDALMEKPSGLTQGRARDDRGRDLRRQQMPVLRRRPRRDPAHPRQESADRRSSRGQPSQGRPCAYGTERCSISPSRSRSARTRSTMRTTRASSSHGFSDDDAWDIAAIAAMFAMSNRLANAFSIRPNDEFYVMGRERSGLR